MTRSLMEATLTMALRLSTPYLFAGLGGLLAQRSGVYNFALEGMMLLGAFFGYLIALTTGSPALGLLGAVTAGLLAGGLLAVFAVGLGVSQLVTCMALNTLFLGLTGFGIRVLNAAGLGAALAVLLSGPDWGFAGPPFLGPILLGQNPMTWAALTLFALFSWFLRYTGRGLALRAAGENPSAARAAGIRVARCRWIAVTVSGGLASLGGAFLPLTQVGRFAEGMTDGRGWIAVAAICLGRWTPAGTLLSCLLFGLAGAVSNQLQALSLGLPHQAAMMVPYLLSLLALVSLRGKPARGPAALGRHFSKE